MTSKNGSPSMRLETITPVQAARYLERNGVNRSLRRPKILQFASDMRRGCWTVQGDCIRFDVNGVLIDGQHRLLACMDAGLAFQTYVIRGLDAATAMPTIDCGTTRSNADFLKFCGLASYALSAAAANKLSWIRSHQPKRSASYRSRSIEPLGCKTVMLEFITKNPLLTEGVALMASTTVPPKFCPKSLIAACWCEFVRTSDRERATEFAASFCSGESLQRGSIILKTRNRILADAVSGRGHILSVSPMAKTILLLRAWNYWITGTPSPSKLLLRTKISAVAETKGHGKGAMLPTILGPGDRIHRQNTATGSRAAANRRKSGVEVAR